MIDKLDVRHMQIFLGAKELELFDQMMKKECDTYIVTGVIAKPRKQRFSHETVRKAIKEIKEEIINNKRQEEIFKQLNPEE